MSKAENPNQNTTANRDQLVDQEDRKAEGSQIKPEKPDTNQAANPGDRINPNQSTEEKAKQVAVDAPDITGDHIKVPTYFMVQEPPDGEEKALHHVKDAEEISDVIRQARTDDEGNRTWR